MMTKFNYSNNWKNIAKERKQLDTNCCAVCGSTEKLQVHHKIPLSKGGDNSMSNLITLCKKHHTLEHKHMFKGSTGLGKSAYSINKIRRFR